MTPIEPVAYDPSRRTDYVELLATVWGDPSAGEHVEWWFEQNPIRPAIVQLVEHEGRLAGTLASNFVRVAVDGEPTLVAVPLRAATLAELRGRGILGALVRANERAAADAGVPLGLTTTNAASTGVFLRNGWQRVAAPRVWVRPRRLRAAEARPPGTGASGGHRVRVEPVERFGEAAEESWRRAAPRYGDAVVGEAAYLNWRYVDAPHDYRRLAATVDGRPGGYLVARRMTERGLATGMICTLVADTGRAARVLLERAADELRGCQVLAAVPPRTHRPSFLAAGYVPSPRTMMLLGKALREGQALPRRLEYGFGDHDLA